VWTALHWLATRSASAHSYSKHQAPTHTDKEASEVDYLLTSNLLPSKHSKVEMLSHMQYTWTINTCAIQKKSALREKTPETSWDELSVHAPSPLWSQSRRQATEHTCLEGKGSGLYVHFQHATHMRNDETNAVAGISKAAAVLALETPSKKHTCLGGNRSGLYAHFQAATRHAFKGRIFLTCSAHGQSTHVHIKRHKY